MFLQVLLGKFRIGLLQNEQDVIESDIVSQANMYCLVFIPEDRLPLFERHCKNDAGPFNCSIKRVTGLGGA